MICCLLVLIAAVRTVSGQEIAVPMRDGARLATNLYLPEPDLMGEQGVPVILVCTPYDRTRERPVGVWRDCFLRNGYAFAVQDMRGFHGSVEAGRGAARHHDGYDTVEWLAGQPWCNGKVGMIGYSHPGAVQYETALTGPPHLAAVIPAQAPGNYYTDAYYPARFRKADMETIWRGAFTAQTEQLIKRRSRHGARHVVGRFNVPMLHSAGWYDFYTEGAIEMFEACQRDGGAMARGNQKLLIGPWGHGVVQEEAGGALVLDGGLAYPEHAKPDWEGEVWLPWFDHWLKGKENGHMEEAAVRYFLMGDADDPDGVGNRWIAAESFPPACKEMRLYPRADFSLREEAPHEDHAFTYRYDPRDPVPTVGRRHVRLPVKGPYDQRPVEDRADVLIFTTAPLVEPLIVVGRVLVRLWVSSDCRDTDFTAKLTDVYPDGRSMWVSDSIVKGRYRNGFEEEFLEAGKVVEIEIDLGYTALAFGREHRVRLAISSSNFDRFDINLNTGDAYEEQELTRKLLKERFHGEVPRASGEESGSAIATNVLHVGPDRGSYLLLPIPLDVPVAR